jgi:hypothetical protein
MQIIAVTLMDADERRRTPQDLSSQAAFAAFSASTRVSLMHYTNNKE